MAASRRWQALTGVEIAWDRRSLQDFETYPVDVLADAYDLIVIDHPHVGVAAAAGALLPFEDADPDIAAGSVGGSFESYRWEGRQWALPIDAAAQVQAWVPSRLEAPLRRWDEVLALAEAGRVALPLRPPHALMSLMTLCGLSGIPLRADDAVLFPAEATVAVERLYALAHRVPPGSEALDPIAVLEQMADPGSTISAAPLVYGYVSYAEAGFRPVRVAFADLAAIDAVGPAGSVLGGTGIAVSSRARDPDAAQAFARWLAGGEVQRGLVAANGGQPAHADAWADDAVNARTLDFYRATRATMDRAWVRPRHHGYMAFQAEASLRIVDAIANATRADALISALNRGFADSLRG